MKKLLLVLGIVGILLFIVECSSKLENKSEKVNNTEVVNNEETEQIKNIYKGDSIRLSNGNVFGGVKQLTTIKDINELALEYAIMQKFEAHSTEEISTVEYIKKESKKQWEKELPSIRKRWVELASNELWEHNIEVYATNGGKTLWFVGVIFASNKNIKEYQNGIEELVKTLGFKKVCYKWIKHTDEYTYYTL